MLHKIAVIGFAVWSTAVASAGVLTYALHRPLVPPSVVAVEPTHMRLAPPLVVEPPIVVAPAEPVVTEPVQVVVPKPAAKPAARAVHKAAQAVAPPEEPPPLKCTEWRTLEQGVGGAKVRTCE